MIVAGLQKLVIHKSEAEDKLSSMSTMIVRLRRPEDSYLVQSESDVMRSNSDGHIEIATRV